MATLKQEPDLFPTKEDIEAANEYVKQATKDAGTSFYWAMRLLPEHKRNAMFALYAFSREVDDIADDEALTDQARAEALEEWRNEVQRIYAQEPKTTIGIALMDAAAQFDIPKEELLLMIDGMQMDGNPIHGMTMNELLQYCRLVAGTVGVLSLSVFGAKGKNADRLAVVQGEALQLTNILRDIKEDAMRDRLYLPTELLEKHGIQTQDPNEVLAHPNLPKACKELAADVEAKYQESKELIAGFDKKQLRPAIIMLDVYYAIFKKLQAHGWKDMSKPISVPKTTKLSIAFKHLIY